MTAESNDLEKVLKPFDQRASDADVLNVRSSISTSKDLISLCMARLEASLAGKKDSGNEEQLSLIAELQSKLDIARTEQVAAGEELTMNDKLKHRIKHLIRAVNDGDAKLEAFERGDRC